MADMADMTEIPERSAVLVFDFGASSGRAMLVSYDGKDFELKELHRFENKPVTRDNTLYWDIDALFSEVEAALRKAENTGYEAVCIDTWGVDFAIVDEKGDFIERPVHYRDSRTAAVIDEVNALFGGEQALYMKTGIMPQWFNTVYQLYALAKVRPENVKRGKLLMMPDVFCHFLTGELHSEYSEATTTALLDPATGDWDRDMVKRIGVSPSILCDIRKGGQVYGYIKPSLCGGRRVPVICVPSHDTASAIAAAPAVEEEFAFISTGTWALFGTELKSPVITGRAFDASLSNEGGHSGTTAFLKNIMGMWLIQECKRDLKDKGRDLSFPELSELARGALPRRYFINPNDASFSQPGDMPDKIRSFIVKTGQEESGKPENITDAQVLRAVYDSLAAEFALTLEDIEGITGKRFNSLYMFGGGSRDRLLCELTCEYSGATVYSGPTEATALGAAACALIGTGKLSGVSEARAAIRSCFVSEPLTPAGDLFPAVRDSYRKFREKL